MTTASPEREKRHWGFPELEIPEAALHPGERYWSPPYRGGDILGLSTREGPEVALHLPKCLKPLIPRTPEATSRPTSAPSFARSTVPVK